jgi:hypothetical protein
MGGCDGVGYVSRSNILFRMEESSARIFQSGLKIGGDVTAGGARDTITKVASESS